MTFWWLAFKDILLTVRDRKALLTLVIMPLVLIAILGSAFANLMDSSGKNEIFDPFQLGIVNEDNGVLSGILEDEVFGGDNMAELITLVKTDRQTLEKQLLDRKLDIGVIIPPGFTDATLAGQKTKIEVVSSPQAGLEPMIVESILRRFSQQTSVNTAAFALAAAQGVHDQERLARLQQELAELSLSDVPFVEVQGAADDSAPVSSFQYYAVGMGVMFLLMTVVTGVGALIEEKEEEVYRRLLITKLTPSHYVAGKFAGLLLTSFLQFIIIIAGTRLLFDVQWGDSLPGVLLVAFSYVFSACGLGVMAGSFVSKEGTFNTIGMLATQIMAALGGSMVPIYIFPDWLNAAATIMPNANTLQAFLDLMAGKGIADVLMPSAMMLGMGIVFLTIGWIRLTATNLRLRRRIEPEGGTIINV